MRRYPFAYVTSLSRGVVVFCATINGKPQRIASFPAWLNNGVIPSVPECKKICA